MTRTRLLTITAVLAVLFLGVATAAQARERAEQARRHRGLKDLGLKVYWSLLDEGQQEQAKQILGEHLVATAADRLDAAARLIRFRADVARLLTPDQIREAARMKREGRARPAAERRALADRLLDGTDRVALAGRAEAHAATHDPAAKVRLGLEMLDQLFEVVEPEVAERLQLTSDQRARLSDLYDVLKADLTPVAIRLETAKAETVVRALDLLTDEQRTQLVQVRDTVVEKILAFLRG